MKSSRFYFLRTAFENVMVKNITLGIVCLAISGLANGQHSQKINPYRFSATKHIIAKHGAVASASPLASRIGVMIMEKGGNAFDAAVAVQFALEVTYPRAGNIGGGGFLLAHRSDGENVAIDYREQAPAKATRYMFVKNGHSIPELRTKGHLSVAIPTTIAGIFLTHQKYGRLPWKDLVQPAIDLAKYGFVLSASEAKSYNSNQKDFKLYNTEIPVFVNKQKWKEGDTLVQKDLAHTLELIRDNGKAGFYEGENARKIVDEMKRGGGLISLADLEHAEKAGAVIRPPIIFNYEGNTIVTMPPSSSGGIALEQMLGMLSRFPVRQYGFESVQAVQLMTEIERRAFADRTTYLTDPDFVKMPLDSIITPHYLKERISTFIPGKATEEKNIKPPVLFPVESKETTHISILDDEGNAVSVTYTLSSNYGSKVMVGNAGFFLNNEMRAFRYNPPKGTIVNTIRPYIRMRSSMTPTIILKGQRPYAVLGTPGSETIITSVFQTIVDLIDFNMSTADVVNNPKFHWNNTLHYVETEKNFPAEVMAEMKKMGYEFKTNQVIGRMELIEVGKEGIEAVADRRGDDGAAGY